MLDVLTNTVAFVFALGVIIFVHEAGHLLMAKAFGVRVLTFSLGFGRRIWGFTRGETEYRVSVIPLGGYVRLGGEEAGEVGDDPAEFLNRPRWQRVLVYLAGPAMNVALSVGLIWVTLMVGLQIAAVQDVPSVVGIVVEGSPGEAAGLRPGDEILTVDGKEAERWSDVQFAITTSPGRPVDLTVERDGRRMELTVTPEKVPRYEFGDAGLGPELRPRVARVLPDSPAERGGFRVGDEILGVDGRTIGGRGFIEYIAERAETPVEVRVERDGEPVDLTVEPAWQEDVGVARIGVELAYAPRYGPWRALVESVRTNIQIAEQTFLVLGKIFSGRLKARSALSGPIEIAAQSGQAARRGLNDLIFLIGLISISIAILNLLPIPILDGGQIFLLLIEGVIRRDLPAIVKERINQVGFVLIIMLMLTVIYFDLVKNLPPGLIPGS